MCGSRVEPAPGQVRFARHQTTPIGPAIAPRSMVDHDEPGGERQERDRPDALHDADHRLAARRERAGAAGDDREPADPYERDRGDRAAEDGTLECDVPAT